jgi:hypothetical protein
MTHWRAPLPESPFKAFRASATEGQKQAEPTTTTTTDNRQSSYDSPMFTQNGSSKRPDFLSDRRGCHHREELADFSKVK